MPLPLAAQRRPDHFASSTRATTFAFENRHGMVVIPIRVNGSDLMHFVLDSGATRTVIDRNRALALGLKTSGKTQFQGAAAEIVPNVTLALPGLVSFGYELTEADLRLLEGTLGIQLDGVIGYELLRRFVVSVDYEKYQVTIAAPGSYRPPPSADVLAMKIHDRWPFVQGELEFPDGELVRDQFLVDSGSSDAVDHPIVMQVKSRGRNPTAPGLKTPVQGTTANAAYFRLGAFTVSSPVVSCCGATPATSKLIGNGVLSHFTVTFDYPNERLYLQPNSAYETR